MKYPNESHVVGRIPFSNALDQVNHLHPTYIEKPIIHMKAQLEKCDWKVKAKMGKTKSGKNLNHPVVRRMRLL